MVAIDPSEPVPHADRNVAASEPRSSPTITRSAPERSDRLASSSMVISPDPSLLASRVSTAKVIGWDWSRNSSKVCSRVHTISDGPISASSARSRVVLPAPSAPHTSTLAGPGGRTAARRKSPACSDSDPLSTRSSIRMAFWRWQRTVRNGVPHTAIAANTRSPLRSRRSSSGADWSKRRPVWPWVVARCEM